MISGDPVVVLLVEDNLDHAELLLRNMADFHLANKVIHLEDGEAALDYLHGRGVYIDRELFPMPHLMLLDLRLPKIDGFQVLKDVKGDSVLRALPVVVLTTSDAEQDIAKAYAYHANSYLTKPVQFFEFSDLLKTLGFYWLVWNKRPW